MCVTPDDGCKSANKAWGVVGLAHALLTAAAAHIDSKKHDRVLSQPLTKVWNM